jgi:D-tyrosyl-tRNA(Tyr) deacylase
MELGSSEENWDHKVGGKAVADAIMNTIRSYLQEVPLNFSDLSNNYARDELYSHIKKNETKSCIGFGGVHYARNFSKLLDRVSISFIAPKYYISELDDDLIDQMIKNTLEPIKHAIIDWNSMNSATRLALIELLEQNDVSWKKRKAV